MINIVNLPTTPKEFFAQPRTVKKIEPIAEGPEDEELTPVHQDVVRMRKEIKRCLSSPALFAPPKLPVKPKYLPDGRKSMTGDFERSQPETLWAQLFQRSLSSKGFKEMIETPVDYESLCRQASVSSEAISPTTSEISTDSYASADSHFSDRSNNACMFLLRKPNSDQKPHS